jgi:hypothetical protein
MAGWQRFVAADELFELTLPPGVMLVADETAPPPETYLYWSSPEKEGTFSIYRQPAPGQSAEGMLALEQELGARITVEINEPSTRFGQPAHHLSYRLEETQPRETVEDPVTGALSHLPTRHIEQVAEYVFWRGEKETLSVGYRVDAGASPELKAEFQRMLESFRLLRPL